MRKLSPFAGVIALAVAFGLAGAASAGRPEGVGGGSPGGSSPTVSEFSSPFVGLDCTNVACVATGVVSDSNGTINSLGDWNVQTSGLINQRIYEVCLAGLHPDEDDVLVETTISLGNGTAETQNGDVVLTLFGTIGAAGDGDWVGLSFQIIEGEGVECSGPLRQESGLTLGSEGASEFSSPFVALNCGTDSCMSPGEVADSYGLINNAGDWAVLTDGLDPGTKYKVCVYAFLAPANVPTLPFRLASRSARKKGSFFASGNMVERYDFAGDWVGLSLQIYEEGGTDTCDGVFVQETGINIVVPPP